MKFEADLHIHTVASGHAYSTVMEIVGAAARKGLKLIGLTDHGPSMPGAPHPYHFGALRLIPEEYKGVEILKGVEANIINFDGELDLEEKYLKKLDFVAVGFHDHACLGGDKDQYTETLLKVLENPFVDIIVHPGNPMFEVDYEKVVEAAGKNGVLLEINNSSLYTSRKGSCDNCLTIAREAASQGIRICVGSDAHWAEDVGRFEHAIELITNAGVKEEQIVNLKASRVKEFIKGRSKMRAPEA
ncbi:MAG: putative hydrolase [Clostridia bacterium]|nr:hypothetical protein [Clostridiales bacterium]MDK2985015.1 putative hydrolase [Clostridia bacterium]